MLLASGEGLLLFFCIITNAQVIFLYQLLTDIYEFRQWYDNFDFFGAEKIHLTSQNIWRGHF